MVGLRNCWVSCPTTQEALLAKDQSRAATAAGMEAFVAVGSPATVGIQAANRPKHQADPHPSFKLEVLPYQLVGSCSIQPAATAMVGLDKVDCFAGAPIAKFLA